MHIALKRELVEHLSGYITPNRKARMEQVLANRTRHLTVVLEDIYQPQNASAVVRSCDCFGVQDVHVIENKYKYKINPDVTLGAAKWVNIIRYNKKARNNTKDCIGELRSRGYRIIATTPHEAGHTLDVLPVERKIALMFGTEETGLTDLALSQADERLTVPMFGFTESFNISVCAALCLYHITDTLRKSAVDWRLSEDEILDLKLQWIRKILKRAALLEQQFLEKKKKH